MPAHIRFTLNKALPPTTLDPSPEILRGVVEGEIISTPDGNTYPLAGVRILPPCSPTKIVCVGRNYPEHAKELGNEVPAEPLIFLKPPSALLAAGDDIVYLKLSQRVDYEGELGVVIGKRARHLTPENAIDHVLGYTCVNDVTARDLQKKDGQWTRGKGFDTSCPVGPYLIPKEDINVDDLRVTTYLNGEKKQDAPVRDMMFSIIAILTYVTQFMTLEPGDLIATGTPPGVGPMLPGSLVQVEIPGIGVLQNRVAREE